MTFDQIETFLLIVQTNSISKAAEKLYMSQSATGSRLLQLEEELGYKLVNRNKKARTAGFSIQGVITPGLRRHPCTGAVPRAR